MTWRDPGHSEAVPAGRLGDKIYAAVLRAHQGDLIEIVVPSGAASDGKSSVVVLSLDQV